MTVEQEINLLANKYGELAVMEAVKNFTQKKVDQELQDRWNMICLSYGLMTQDFNAQFSNGKDTFYLREIKPNNRKYPIIANRSDGRSYKFTVDAVKMYLGRRGV